MGEPEPEHKVGSPHTTILDLSTIVQLPSLLQHYLIHRKLSVLQEAVALSIPLELDLRLCYPQHHSTALGGN